MTHMILAVVATFAVSAFAGADDFALVTCDVKTLADARKCMEREAKAQNAYEEPNDGWASERVDMLAGIMRVLGNRKATVDKANGADFAGAVGIHMDEHHVVYYSIKKGKNVRPEILTDMNIADLTYAFEDGSKIPPAGLFALGLEDFKKSDIYDDIVDHLDYVKQEREEESDREAEEDPTALEPAVEYAR